MAVQGKCSFQHTEIDFTNQKVTEKQKKKEIRNNYLHTQ